MNKFLPALGIAALWFLFGAVVWYMASFTIDVGRSPLPYMVVAAVIGFILQMNEKD